MGNKDTQLFGLPVVKSPNIRLEKLFGWVVIVVFFGGFGLWAYFAPLESAAIVPGKIAVAGHRRTVQHLEGGVVDKINVKDGSRVKKGEVLVEMDNTKAKAELQITHNVYVSLLAAEARLSAELKDEKTVRFSQTVENTPKVRVDTVTIPVLARESGENVVHVPPSSLCR